MASKDGLTWSNDQLLVSGLAKAEQRAVQYLARTTEYYSLRSETYAKSNAKWKDRSGNARSSLGSTYNAETGSRTARFEIDVFHGMPYGIFLELRWRGKYSIINPTIEIQGKKFLSAANSVMARMFGGTS